MKRLSLGMILVVAVAVAAAAQTPSRPPAKGLSGSLGLYAFPAKNQDAATQQADEAACYAWSKENTGFDPLDAAMRSQPPAAEEQHRGARLKSAAGGAAAGAAIGAIAGDAGKGAATGAAAGGIRGRLATKKAEQRAQQQQGQMQKQQSASVSGFQKAFGACMEGKGYAVK